MMQHSDSLVYKLRHVVTGIVGLALIVAAIILLAGLPASANSSNTSSNILFDSDSPNAITSGMSVALDDFEQSTTALQQNLAHAGTALTSGLHVSSRLIMHGASSAGHGIAVGATTSARMVGRGVIYSGLAVGRSLAFVFRIPASILGAVSQAPVVSSVIRPADHETVPTISSGSSLQLASVTTPMVRVSPAAAPAAPPIDMTPMWPIHGEITTEFGVPHWPFQPTHTGIDISDGAASGVTLVHPYKPGRVIAVIHSDVSLGNHVIVDHGNGLTSVYGHMYSTSVVAGQQVDHNTVLGLEGTTGASTGPHVHLEIRVNDQPVNPHLYIQGQP